MTEPVKKYFRLAPGKEVRLKSAYFITCTGYETDDDGNVTLLHCTYDEASKGGNSPDGRKVKGTLQWVSAEYGVDAEIRLYDRLFNAENPSSEVGVSDFKENLNPDSLIVLNGKVEPYLKQARRGDTFQFMRTGYFTPDYDSAPDKLIFNRTVALKDSWAKIK